MNSPVGAGRAVQVQDDYEKIDYATNPEAVRIHDNFISSWRCVDEYVAERMI